MTVGTLRALLEPFAEDREIIVQDLENDAVLQITGVWIPAEELRPLGTKSDAIQLTTEQS